MTEPHFSLVVLCYRSGQSIIPFVERLQRTLSRCNFSWELVLVGNYIEGSDDETPQVVKKLAEQSQNIRTVIRPKQGMMGWDMRMGLDTARGTYIGVIDGDGQFPPESIIACLLKCELEDLDLTKTYRVIRDDAAQVRLEVQIDYVQSRVSKRNVFSVPAAPELNILPQKQLAQHANCERRRGAGDEDSHGLRNASLQPG